MPSSLVTHLRRNLIAYVALFVALGGTSYAAVSLPRNSVGTAQVKKSAVTSAKVKNGSLVAKDFKAGQLPRGAQGLKGDTGATGVQGPAGVDGATGEKGDKGDAGADATKLWAVVNTNGSLARGSGVTASTRPVPAQYTVTFNRDVSKCAYIAVAGNATSGANPPNNFAAVTPGVSNVNAVFVEMRDHEGFDDDASFHLAVFC